MPTSTPQARQTWLKFYQQLGSVSLAARRCGIARSTLHRWLKRQDAQSLTDHPRRPHRLAAQTTPEEVARSSASVTRMLVARVCNARPPLLLYSGE